MNQMLSITGIYLEVQRCPIMDLVVFQCQRVLERTLALSLQDQAFVPRTQVHSGNFLKARTISDGKHEISVLVPSLLLTKTRMISTEVVAREDEVEVLLLWVLRFFSIRDPSTVGADLLPLF